MGLGSILGTIGGVVGAPFTGGTSLAWGPALGAMFDGVSSTTGGAAKATQTQANETDKIKLALENAKLNRDKYALAAPGARLGTGIKASLASNFTPSKLDWGPNGFKPGAIAAGKAPMPTRTGGVSGGMANLSPDTKTLANQVMHDEMVSQMQGGASGGGTDSAMPTDIAKPSTGGNVLGGVAMGSSILSLLQKAMANRTGSTQPSTNANSDDWSDVEG